MVLAACFTLSMLTQEMIYCLLFSSCTNCLPFNVLDWLYVTMQLWMNGLQMKVVTQYKAQVILWVCVGQNMTVISKM